uniref:SWI/SNF-related matrix-associated actin-dependent regulator of chromatin subfamily A containing DEAD/H box 1 n=1 Tax=Schistocephalus solidus TaxID=70667 RepID=A0A183T3F0_SCHSO
LFLDSEAAPHFIVNLDCKFTSFNDTIFVAFAEGSEPSVPQPATPAVESIAQTAEAPQAPTSIPVPEVPSYSSYVRVGKPKGRARGSYKPLNEMVETRIRTYEGADSHTKISTLMQHFPSFRRSIIDKCFTKNLLNFEETYKELYAMHKQQQEALSKIRLVLTPKVQKPKKTRIIPNIKAPELINTPFVRGRPSRRSGNRYYRRVIVGKDGSVESAEVTEKNYIRNSDAFRTLVPHSVYGDTKVATETNISRAAIVPSVSANDQPDQPTANTQQPYQPPSGNRFFRSNRISDAEMKKREYVTKELQGPANTRVQVLRSSKSEAELSEGVEESAANFMAGVGVVSTPNANRRRGRKTRGKANDLGAAAEQEQQEQTSQDDIDDAPAEELSLMPGCSQKTAEIIINLRPFKNSTDLKLRLDSTRHLSTNLIDSFKELMHTRSMFSSLLNSCEDISLRVLGRLKNLLADCVNLPISETTDAKGDSEGFLRKEKMDILREQPVILHPLRQLKPYQLVGLNWLRILHEEHVNGILADEMGLGKTVQAIAFLAYLWENGERGPHLIVCPSSTVDNWKRELHNWCSQLKVLVYQGAADQRKAMRLKIYESGNKPDFNILLTSYNVATGTLEDRALMKRVDFRYGIFDEGHMLKNMTTQRYKTISSFQIQRRLLLTGTPLQNNLMELVSLLAFVTPNLFLNNSEHLKRIFHLMGKSTSEEPTPAKSKQSREAESAKDGENSPVNSVLLPNRSQFERERVEQAKKFLQPFCLRRLKSQVLHQLPPKTEETVYVPLTESQRKSYLDLIDKFRNAQPDTLAEDDDLSEEAAGPMNPVCLYRSLLANNESATASTQESNRPTPFNMIMQLRKAANHDLLLSGIAYSDETLKELSVILQSDPTHAEADPTLVFEDLCALSDHQVHKVCRLYDVLNPFALPPEALLEGSGKLKWLDSNIPRLLKEGHRILIFSQLVIILDILGEYLVNKGNKFLRLDGSTPVQDRQTLIDTFNDDETYEIFLLSTKAGGLGISLTGADIVILHDLDFNPYNDRQAADRCHRLGQTKPVHVIRLVSEGTIEENIWRTAEEKLRLEEDVTDFAREEGVTQQVDTRHDQNGVAAASISEDVEDSDSMAADYVASQTVPGGKRLLQSDIIKYLSEALSSHGCLESQSASQ